MTIKACVASIRQHLDTAGETVDRETKALEQKFARMFLERLRLECAGLTEEELKASHPDAYHLLAHGLPNSGSNVHRMVQGKKCA
jgi:hypothetical protein